MSTFTIIVPSSGRDTLGRTLASISSQMRVGDEIICAVNNDGEYGAKSIDRAQERALGTHLLYCDDDDVFVPGGLDAVRAWADEHPGTIGIFRRTFPIGGAQWDVPALVQGNIQRMCLCIPNVAGKLPRWEGTWTEALIPEQAAELQGAEIVFVDRIIGLARPESNPWRRLRYRLRARERLRTALASARQSA